MLQIVFISDVVLACEVWQPSKRAACGPRRVLHAGAPEAAATRAFDARRVFAWEKRAMRVTLKALRANGGRATALSTGFPMFTKNNYNPE